MKSIPNTLKLVVRYGMALVVVGLATVTAQGVIHLAHTSRVGAIYLSGVLVVSYWLGSGPGYLAAAAAFLAYDYYVIAPPDSLSLNTVEDVVTLTSFLAVAMLTGNLTGRVRDQAARSQARARTTGILFDATQEFAASSDEAYIRQRLAHHLARAARGEAIVRDGPRLFSAPVGRPRLGAMALTPTGGWSLWPLVDNRTRLGEAAWRTTEAQPMSREEQTLVEILADAGAAAIARARLAAEKAEAEARARTEDLRNALLSSISHDLRTPLAAILASASSLHEFGESFAPAVRTDLAATIQEEAIRLDAFVANLLQMTRLESGSVSVHRVAFCVAEALQGVVDRRLRTAPGSLQVQLDPDLPEAMGDARLFEQALGNVVDNALKYARTGGPVTVTARRGGDEVVVEVADHGPGVPEYDLERIFQKFYRSAGGAGKAGTGLGLSIARGLMEGMGGSISARNRGYAAQGLAVTLTMPAVAA